MAQDGQASGLVGKRDIHDFVCPGPERRVDRRREVARGEDENVGVAGGEPIEPDQRRVDRPVDVDRVGLHAQGGPIGEQRLDLVEQHDKRTGIGKSVQEGPEELLDGALAPARATNWPAGEGPPRCTPS